MTTKPDTIKNKSFMDNLCSDVFGDGFAFPRAVIRQPEMRQLGRLETDIKECEDHYELDMNLPGFAKEDVKAELHYGYLTVTASHSEEKEDKDEEGRYVRRERYSGQYQRNFYVGEDLTEDEITAKYVDGVLKICIPKPEKKEEAENKNYINIE